MGTTLPQLDQILNTVAQRARDAGVFGRIHTDPTALRCAAANSAEPAEYGIVTDDGTVFVQLTMADRWQSGSIEADLVNSGDKLDELIEEEMADLGYMGKRLPFEHFRSEEMLFTFRSPLPAPDAPNAAEVYTQALLGYEACFRQLGDMDAGDDDD